jgi:hypothetical protein
VIGSILVSSKVYENEYSVLGRKCAFLLEVRSQRGVVGSDENCTMDLHLIVILSIPSNVPPLESSGGITTVRAYRATFFVEYATDGGTGLARCRKRRNFGKAANLNRTDFVHSRLEVIILMTTCSQIHDGFITSQWPFGADGSIAAAGF